MWTLILTVLGLSLLAASLYCAWHATVNARTPQGAVGWVVFLLSAPYIAFLPYIFLGRHKYRGYMIARRDSESVVHKFRNFADRLRPPSPPVEKNMAVFEKIAQLPALRGNSMQLLINGEEVFKTIFAAIDAAENYVLAQFFIIRDDKIGREFRDHLIAAAKRGVTVRLLFDAFGSNALPDSYFEALEEAGVHVMDRSVARGPSTRFQINYRNHRKTVVVDGKIGFTGGLNVGDEYCGKTEMFEDWRDTHLRIEGPAVLQLQLIFGEDWHWTTGGLLLEELDWSPRLCKDDLTALIVASGPADDLESGSLLYFSAIVAAKRRIWISSPYFVPDAEVIAAFKNAAMKGLDVRILVPEYADHKMPWYAAYAFFDELTAVGVEIWRYREGFCHQKIILIDDDFAAVGTANLDHRSFRLNFETMALFFDKRAATAVELMLADDFTRADRLSKKLSDQPLHIRIGAPLARLFAPLL